MKKVTFALSALAITATVGTAMAHSKALNTIYCVAHIPGSSTPTSYNGNPTNPQGTICSLTILRTENEDPTAFTLYGFIKPDPDPEVLCPNQEFCPALPLINE